MTRLLETAAVGDLGNSCGLTVGKQFCGAVKAKSAGCNFDGDRPEQSLMRRNSCERSKVDGLGQFPPLGYTEVGNS